MIFTTMANETMTPEGIAAFHDATAGFEYALALMILTPIIFLFVVPAIIHVINVLQNNAEARRPFLSRHPKRRPKGGRDL